MVSNYSVDLQYNKGRITINKKRRFFQNFVSEYKATLKPQETEEPINQYFNRPAAFLVAKLFYRLNRSPNFVTLFSMVFGVSSGYFFSLGRLPFTVYSAVLLEFMIIFDCADGQLARISGNSSPFGKTLDALADIATHFSIFYGVAFALFRDTGSYVPFVLAVFSQLSMYFHIILYDHFKNVFINVTKPGYIDRVETLEQMRKRLKLDDENTGRLKKLPATLYYLFYRFENMVVSIGYTSSVGNFYKLFPDPDRIDTTIRDMYYRKMRVSVKLWSLIGDTIHLTIFVACGLVGRLALVFPILLLYTNGMMVVALLYQRVKFKHLGLEKEILRHEQVD